VRFFGGFGLAAAASLDGLVESGYRDGVPMGSLLPDAGEASAPAFNVWAQRDPRSGTLDRIQIVKGWLAASGGLQEAVFDVVWAGDRKPGPGGRLPPVGNSVDLRTAEYTDAIGAAELIGHWADADFDPNAPAYYYLRVLQVPTPRWSTYDAVRSGLPLLDGAPATVQERAWSSPIWYAP
jgi:hypothetical protein